MNFEEAFKDELEKIAVIRGQPFRKSYTGELPEGETGGRPGDPTHPSPGGMLTRPEIATKLKEARQPWRRTIEHPTGGGRAESHGALSTLRTYAQRIGSSGEDVNALDEHWRAYKPALAAGEKTKTEAIAREAAGKVKQGAKGFRP